MIIDMDMGGHTLSKYPKPRHEDTANICIFDSEIYLFCCSHVEEAKLVK